MKVDTTTYAEIYADVRNTKAFDWDQFLKREPHTIETMEWENARCIAGSWPTCAVGSQCNVLPRLNDGTPEDLMLFSLGNRFYDAIYERDLEKAQKLMQRIEIRSTELLQDMGYEVQ